MNIHDYLVKTINRHLKTVSYDILSEKTGLRKSNVFTLKTKKGGRIETKMLFLVLMGDEIKLIAYGSEISISAEDAKNKMEQAKAQLKEIIKKVVEEKHESFRSASLSIGKKENYIWEKLKRDSGMDGLFFILQKLDEKVDLYINGERMTYNLADVF